jgi:hypothetical protein
MIQRIVIKQNFVTGFLVVENRDWNTPRSLTRNTPFIASRYEGCDTILSNLRNPLDLKNDERKIRLILQNVKLASSNDNQNLLRQG